MLMPGFAEADTIVPPLVLLLVALGLDALFGGRAGAFAVVPHPVRLIGWLIDRLDATLNRGGGNDLRIRALGVLAVALVCGLCGGIGWGIGALVQRFPPLVVIELALLASMLAQRSLFIHVRAVARALRAGGLAAGRLAVGQIVGRDVETLDESGVARAAIESAAENFSDGVVAPVFWTVLFGLPGLLVYKAANTLDSMIGHKNARYGAFGWSAARFDDLLNLVPARLSGLLIVAAAAILRVSRGGAKAHENESWSPSRARAVMMRDARRHRSPNAGWPEAAAAGALDLRLAGPRRYGETMVDEPWLGDGRQEATAADIDRMLRLHVAACVLNAAVVAVLTALSSLAVLG